MSSQNIPIRDTTYQTGIGAVMLSLIVFCIPLFSGHSTNDTMGVFMINYIITAVYFFTLLFSGRLRKKKEAFIILYCFSFCSWSVPIL